jgi:hypothetical protein
VELSWNRVAAIITPAPDKKVAHFDIKTVGGDFTGDISITDIMLQEGGVLAGYIPHLKEMHLRKRDTSNVIEPLKHFGIVLKGGTTCIIIPNTGDITTAIDFILYPFKPMAPGTVEFSHQYRQRWWIPAVQLNVGDVYEFRSSNRVVALNGIPNKAGVGTYLECAAGDSKFNIKLPPGTSARLEVEIVEWTKGTGGRML